MKFSMIIPFVAAVAVAAPAAEQPVTVAHVEALAKQFADQAKAEGCNIGRTYSLSKHNLPR